MPWLQLSIFMLGISEPQSLERCGKLHPHHLLPAAALSYAVDSDVVRVCGKLRYELCYCDRKKAIGDRPQPPEALYEVSIPKAELIALTSQDRSAIPSGIVPSRWNALPHAVPTCTLPMTVIQTDKSDDHWTLEAPKPTTPGLIQVIQGRGDMQGETDIGVVVDSPHWPQTALVNISFYGTPGRHEYGWLPWALAYARSVVLAPLYALYVLTM